MDHSSADRRIDFQPSSPSSQANVSDSVSVSTPLSPHTGSLRARRFPSQRMVCPDGNHHHRSHSGAPGSTGGGIVALTRLENQELFGSYPALPTLQHRHHSDPIVSVLARPSLDSIADLLSSTSPTSQALAMGPSFCTGRDSLTVQDCCTLQNQHSLSKGVAIVYSPASSPSDLYSRGADHVSLRGISVTEEDANEDRVQVRVEGYYENNGVGVLIPNDLPRSTLLYVLTASDGRDLMFKLIQYSLQLAICLLKTSSLFSPEVQVLMGRIAERLYRNYNTIRHGRSLFKMGRGLLNLFTLQAVCERMWMKHESGIARATCAVMLPVVSRLERGLILMGASSLWGQCLSGRLLRWAQAAQAKQGQSRGEVPEDSMVADWRIQQRMREQPSKSPAKDTLLADKMCTHASEVEKAAQAAGGSFTELKSCSGSTSLTPQKATDYAGDAVSSGGAEMLQPVFPCTAGVGTRTNIFRERPGQQSPATGVSELPLPPSVSFCSLSAEAGAADDWGGRTPKTATAAPTPIAGSKCDSTGPRALPRVASDPAVNSAFTTSSGEEDIVEPHDTDNLTLIRETVHRQLQRHGLTPSATADAATNALSPATEDWVDKAGRKTLLRPLKRPSNNGTPAPTANSSVTSGDVGDHLHGGAENSITHKSTPLMPAPRSPSYESMSSQLMTELVSGDCLTPGDGPLSVPNNWRMACAPTVPPSHSDEPVASPALPYSSVDLLSPLKPAWLSCTTASPSEVTTKPDGTTNSTSRVESADTQPPPPPLSSAAGVSTSTQAVLASSVDGTQQEGQRECSTATAIHDTERNDHHSSSLRNHWTAFMLASTPPATAVLCTSVLPMTTSTRASSISNDVPPLPVEKYCRESDLSILSTSTVTGFHEYKDNHIGAHSTWLRELQPASTALPARWRKGVLQFNSALMALLGFRNLAAACRRFLRDATLISTEHFTTFTFIEAHRRVITLIINRCWLVVSIIDLLLNTVRLLQPGWVKYTTARQNIHCRCGCSGDDDPEDRVWRMHGFIARRKTNLFFPPLDLDYGAPFVSSLAYVEAADPARLMPACSRCGFLYREIFSESDQGEEAEEADASGGVPVSPSRTLAVTSKAEANTSFVQHTAAAPTTAASLSEDGHTEETRRSPTRMALGSPGLIEREKPRWVQLYNDEVMRVESQQQQQRLRSPGARWEAQNPSDEAHQNSPVEQLVNRRNSHAVKTSVGDGQPADEMHQRRKSGAAHKRAAESSAGILLVPWVMRKFFDYVWLLRVHPNLTSTVLLEARCIAELYLAYKYCFGKFESFRSDAPLSAILYPYGALAGMVSASVGLLRVIESAPAS
ncbi:hypothetical_protein (plasmid) [Leishmania braziliensis MHOM/BR/75/M2904]|nr:unnamed protein product [Leishmania braziliensis]SYZ63508.1 hypothetical_protein [Leishmania braziliensis MHOM/BR/75/M2904]